MLICFTELLREKWTWNFRNFMNKMESCLSLLQWDLNWACFVLILWRLSHRWSRSPTNSHAVNTPPPPRGRGLWPLLIKYWVWPLQAHSQEDGPLLCPASWLLSCTHTKICTIWKHQANDTLLIILRVCNLYSLSRFCKEFYIVAMTLTAAYFKPLIFLCWASPCPMLQIFLHSWFCMASAWCVHYFVMKSSTWGILKATCKSPVGVRLGKLPNVRRGLFFWRCTFQRYVSAANSQAGQPCHCRPSEYFMEG